MIDLINNTHHKIDISLLERILNSLTKKDLELMIVDDEMMREINRVNRGIDKSTDVLSFPIEDFFNSPLGSVVINIDRAKSASKEYGHHIDEEIALLFIHGLLHLLGYDHEIDDGQMREMERDLIKEFNLPDSLIVRSENGS